MHEHSVEDTANKVDEQKSQQSFIDRHRKHIALVAIIAAIGLLVYILFAPMSPWNLGRTDLMKKGGAKRSWGGRSRGESCWGAKGGCNCLPPS